MKITSWFAAVFALAVTSGFAASSVPVVSNVAIAQNGKKVTIGYDFTGEAGIVTLDIQTNTVEDASGDWVSIGIDNFGTSVSGDAFCVVRGTGRRELVWQPKQAWPGHFVSNGTIRAYFTAYATNTPPRWMAIPLVTNATTRTRFYDREVPGGITDRRYKTEELLMRKIEVACRPWVMGISASGDSRKHEVIFTEDYYLGIYEFTCGQAQAGKLVSNEYDDQAAVKPLVNVAYSSFRGCDYIYTRLNLKHTVYSDSYVGKLRSRTKVPLDLPSEAEWECAARAGRYGTPSNWTTILTSEAWTGTQTDEVQEVGTRNPNDWDMYDMLGNCWEAVLDFYGSGLLDSYFKSSAARVDPHGPDYDSSALIMMVGEGVGHTYDYYSTMWCTKRSDYQFFSAAVLGFRLWAPGIVSWD